MAAQDTFASNVTDGGGNVQHFDNWANTYANYGTQNCGQAKGFRLTGWTFANGVKDTVTYGDPQDPNAYDARGIGIERILSVSNSLGRQINFEAETWGVSNGSFTLDNNLTGGDLRTVTYAPGTWLGRGATTATFTDPAGQNTLVSMNDWMTQSYTRNAVPWQTVNQIFTPDHPTLPAIEYDYDTLGHISQVRDAINLQVGDHTVAGGRDPTQFFIANGGRGERDDPLGEGYAVYYDQWGPPSRFLDELGRETDQLADHLGRVLTTTYPEGDYEQLTYDVRNNALSKTYNPKPGSAQVGQSLLVSMIYKEAPTVALCVHVATCNKPSSSLSANGWTSLYGWNSDGTLASVQLPLDPTSHRPETDYTYSPFGGDGFTLLTGKTQKITPTQSVTTSYAYNAGNHYVPQSVTVDPTAIDPGGLNLITTLAYNAQGDVISVKGPRTDLDPTAYTSFFTYDLDRRNLFAIQPDQDGAGPQPRVATLKTYDLAGHLLETDRGTTTATDGTGFAVNNWVKEGYDADFNKVLETTGTGSAGSSTTTTATQFAYDGANRVLCTAVRMNPVQYATLPSDGCTLGPAGSFGPDRITKTIYDAAGQDRQDIRGFGTAAQQVYATHDYEPDGKEVAIADADAGIAVGSYNLDETTPHPHQTNYAYDGFDRLITTTYADGTVDKIMTYDSDGNVKKRKTRANEAITYTYDTNDRMATKTVPAVTLGTVTIPASTTTWTYDLINEVINLADTNGNTLANTYDLAGRQLTASQALPGMTGGAKTVTYTYDDGAGDKVDRSQVQWPDGWFVNYNYDALGHMTSATDSDGTALATRTYDDYTRPATQQYPNVNDNIAWGWTGEDDLATMTNNLASTTSDVSFTNHFTPAHQIADAAISNAAYKYAPPVSGTDVYAAPNGLNQYTNITPAGGAAQSITYDARGNLTFDGVLTLGYDPENHLMTASKTGMTASYLYDPLGRRTTKTVGSTVTNFLHDGDTEIGEYDGTGTLLRRFVPGLP